MVVASSDDLDDEIVMSSAGTGAKPPIRSYQLSAIGRLSVADSLSGMSLLFIYVISIVRSNAAKDCRHGLLDR
jgi:hypothetical protein